MSCFPCFQSQKNTDSRGIKEDLPVAQALGPPAMSPPPPAKVNQNVKDEANAANATDDKNSAAQIFTFRELAVATKNFRQECLLGEGGFGRVYKGTLQPNGKVVAVKQLDRSGMQGNKEFLVEVLMLSLLRHPNLVSLIGYCADGDQRLLVNEYMPLGSIEKYLLDISEDKKPLDWVARMKIASGAAEGLEYLHQKANPPVIYRDLKSSNILLDEDFNPRLSDFGLAKLGLGGNKMNVMGTYGYSAPEYERTGELTVKADVYSFGVFLLELITGRRAIDTTRPIEEQNLVSWAQPFFKDPKRFPEMADPLLKNSFPVKSLNQAVGVAAMCLQEEPSVRPLISDVVAALSFLMVAQDESVPSSLSPPSQPSESHGNHGERDRSAHQHDNRANGDHTDDGDGSSSESSDSSDEDSADHQEEDNSDKPQGQAKKTVKWASRCKSKGRSADSSSSSNDSDGSVQLGSNSRERSNMESQDGSDGSSSSDDSDV